MELELWAALGKLLESHCPYWKRFCMFFREFCKDIYLLWCERAFQLNFSVLIPLFLQEQHEQQQHLVGLFSVHNSIRLFMRVPLSFVNYRVHQRGCSLTHSARTPPAVHQGITIWVDEIEFEKK